MKKKWPDFLWHEHDPVSISRRLSRKNHSSLVRDLIYGAIDGTVTTFSIVAGVSGADLPVGVILVLGISNVISDGFSMAAGNYLATKSELDERSLVKEYETEQISINPKGETEEIRQIFKAKGFEGELLENVVAKITRNKEEWLGFMLAEEYGLGSIGKSPLKAAGMTFLAFLAFGMIPMLPYVFGLGNTFTIATYLTGGSFFLLGALKSIWAMESAIVSGLKTLVLGSVAASLAYIVGVVLKDFVNF